VQKTPKIKYQKRPALSSIRSWFRTYSLQDIGFFYPALI